MQAANIQDWSTKLETLDDAARNRRLIKLTYPSERGWPDRVVEPYSLIEHPVILRGWQRAPEAGWRILPILDVATITLLPETFEPRRRITLNDSGLLKIPAPPTDSDPWLAARAVALPEAPSRAVPPPPAPDEPPAPSLLARYGRLVLMVLRDLAVDEDEIEMVERFVRQHRLAREYVLAEHLRVFQDLLALTLKDGKVTEEERELLRQTNQCLEQIGGGLWK